jgi:hypothetical protein
MVSEHSMVEAGGATPARPCLDNTSGAGEQLQSSSLFNQVYVPSSFQISRKKGQTRSESTLALSKKSINTVTMHVQVILTNKCVCFSG